MLDEEKVKDYLKKVHTESNLGAYNAKSYMIEGHHLGRVNLAHELLVLIDKKDFE